MKKNKIAESKSLQSRDMDMLMRLDEYPIEVVVVYSEEKDFSDVLRPLNFASELEYCRRCVLKFVEAREPILGRSLTDKIYVLPALSSALSASECKAYYAKDEKVEVINLSGFSLSCFLAHPVKLLGDNKTTLFAGVLGAAFAYAMTASSKLELG